MVAESQHAMLLATSLEAAKLVKLINSLGRLRYHNSVAKHYANITVQLR